jgi:hypothetical protein
MHTKKMLAISLAVAFAAVAGSAAAQTDWQKYKDQVRVKKALSSQMTPEQYQAHVEKMAKFLAERAAHPPVRTPADTCGAATYEVSTLPFGPAASTTVGATDDYHLPADTTAPTCTASSACTGAPSGQGSIYTGTGTGPDFAFRIRTSADCALTVTMDPTGTEDMALEVFQTQCSSALTDCNCVDDTGLAGTAEQVTLSAVAGTDYFLVADGYSAGGTPPGPSGPFTMAVDGTGCTLTPVDLQNFSID